MKALILAAGLGSRLAPLTDHCPKGLVRVNGKPILFKQIENLHENGIIDITVISGYEAKIMEHELAEHFPGVKIIRSDDYATTNNMYSAYLAHKYMEGHDFLMMNADVFFDSSVIATLLASASQNAIVTDIGRYLDESMKVTEKDGRLTSISKQIPPQDAFGTTIDVYKFSKDGGKVFFDICKEYIEIKQERKLWSEVALDQALSKIVFKACPLTGRWVEIDNHEDLEIAEKMFLEV